MQVTVYFILSSFRAISSLEPSLWWGAQFILIGKHATRQFSLFSPKFPLKISFKIASLLLPPTDHRKILLIFNFISYTF